MGRGGIWLRGISLIETSVGNFVFPLSAAETKFRPATTTLHHRLMDCPADIHQFSMFHKMELNRAGGRVFTQCVTHKLPAHHSEDFDGISIVKNFQRSILCLTDPRPFQSFYTFQVLWWRS